jgi:hypothetical protein
MSRNACRTLVGKPEGERLLGRPRRRWGVILKCILEKYDKVACTGLIRLRTGTDRCLSVSAIMNFRVPENVRKCLRR